MKPKLLLLDSNSDMFDNYYSIWIKYDIVPVQILTMQEAIVRLSHEEFVIVIINADNIDFYPQLAMMRDTTSIPIHIYSSNYTIEFEYEAITLGANIYTKLPDDINKMIMLESIRIRRYTEISLDFPLNLIMYKNISLYLDYRKVFVNDIEVDLTRREFDILHMLLENCRRVFTYDQIYIRAWGNDYIGYDNNALFNEIKRLRKKLRDVDHSLDCIKNVHNIGYAFDR